MKVLRLTIGYVLIVIVSFCVGLLVVFLSPFVVLALFVKWLFGCMVEALDRGML